ncbi:MAG: prepilin-type N-terminal cleavage/methylation domain-containing protein [Gemmatimonadales bacterium]|nr:MAG: prepilin-type N-terminal cleavage/methylation domain-containing protein [Gemmatimonadales bacterium]
MPNRKGFTLLELIIVIVIGTILSGIVLLAFSQVQGQLAVRNANASFLSLHSQARAFAVERGENVRFVVDRDAVQVRVELVSSGEVLNSLSFGQEFDVTMTGSGSSELVFTPRGVADGSGSRFTVEFVRGPRNRTVEVLQLGQAREIG